MRHLLLGSCDEASYVWLGLGHSKANIVDSEYRIFTLSRRHYPGLIFTLSHKHYPGLNTKKIRQIV